MHASKVNVNGFLSAALALSLIFASVPTGVIAADSIMDRESAIKLAADHLVDNQNTDGGFGWTLPTGDTSYTNVLGITAIGILKANEFQNKDTFETALAGAYDYAFDNPPAYTWNAGTEKYVESTKGVDSSPDMTYLVWLAQAAASDASLLNAVEALHPGTTVDTIADLAKARWDTKILYWGSTRETDPNGTAVSMAKRLLDDRLSQGLPAVGIWDLELAVKAALALDSYFPSQGYRQEAEDIADMLFASVDSGSYFSSTNTSQSDYMVGLTGAIEAFAETGRHLGKAANLKDVLLDLQQADGSWKYYGTTPAEKSVQSTAYALMALNSLGGAEEMAAARKGADWLVKSQNLDGGWYAEGGAGDEILEADSEAAWALAVVPATVTIGDLGYYSIQSAIDSAVAGDTILVGAGTYAEDLEFGKSVILTGPNADVSPNGGARNPEAVIGPIDEGPSIPDPAVKITAPDISVTIQGFNLDMTNAGEGDRFVDMISKQNVSLDFQKNIFSGAEYSVNGNWYISGDNTGFDLTVDDNFFTGNASSNGIALFSNTVHNIAITNNTWEDNQGWAMNFNNVHGVISSNTFLDKIDNGPVWSDDQVGFILASTDNDVTMSNNLFDGIISPAVNLYETFGGALAADHNIFKNIQGDLAAVRVRGVTADISNVTFSCNQFVDNFLDISNPKTTPFAASHNWWGSISGPDVVKLSGDVVYQPWAGDTACTWFMPPAANDQSVTTAYQTPLEITLTAADVGENTMTWTPLDEPAHGTLTGTGPTLTYTPDPGFSGSDSFTFQASLAGVDSNVGTVTISVSDQTEWILYFPILFKN